MTEFTDYLTEVFSHFGPIRTRRMFGGHGVYHEYVMIGLVADDTLYLKADKLSAAEFTALELPQFSYQKSGKTNKTVAMSYYQAPADALDDPDEMRH